MGDKNSKLGGEEKKRKEEEVKWCFKKDIIKNQGQTNPCVTIVNVEESIPFGSRVSTKKYLVRYVPYLEEILDGMELKEHPSDVFRFIGRKKEIGQILPN